MGWTLIGIAASAVIAFVIFLVQRQRRKLSVVAVPTEYWTRRGDQIVELHATVTNHSDQPVHIASAFVEVAGNGSRSRIGIKLQADLLPGGRPYTFLKGGHWVATTFADGGFSKIVRVRLGVFDSNGNEYASEWARADLDKWTEDKSWMP